MITGIQQNIIKFQNVIDIPDLSLNNFFLKNLIEI